MIDVNEKGEIFTDVPIELFGRLMKAIAEMRAQGARPTDARFFKDWDEYLAEPLDPENDALWIRAEDWPRREELIKNWEQKRATKP